MTEMAAFVLTLVGGGALAGVGIAGIVLMRRVLAPNPPIEHDPVVDAATVPDGDPGRPGSGAV